MEEWDFSGADRFLPKYDWGKWADGRSHPLRMGTDKERKAGTADFSIPVRSFQQLVYGYARRRGWKARTERDKADTGMVHIRITR